MKALSQVLNWINVLNSPIEIVHTVHVLHPLLIRGVLGQATVDDQNVLLVSVAYARLAVPEAAALSVGSFEAAEGHVYMRALSEARPHYPLP